MENTHPWKARLGVGIAMLLLAFLGMVVTDIHTDGGWGYWEWIVPVYAMLALWLSWFVRRKKETISPITLGHELLHWIGVIAAVFLASYFIKLGVFSRFLAGIVDLLLLSLGVFLAGIYIESTFLLIGLVLGCFAWVSAVIVQYLYAVMIPVLLGAFLIIGIMIWMSHKKASK